MKIITGFSVLAAIILIYSQCEYPPDHDEVPINEPVLSEYSVLEKEIREMYDSRAVFTWSQYRDLLLKLSSGKFLVLPLEAMRNTFNDTLVVVGLRHDIDWNPFKAIEMAKMERDLGFHATYFVLPTSNYYGSFDRSGLTRNACVDSVYKVLFHDGNEIGIHNDLLTVMIEYKLDPFTFNWKELLYLRLMNIPVWGTASHGSTIAKATVPNYQIFSDYAKAGSVTYLGVSYPIGLHSLNEYGFKYEAYFISFNKYFSESGGHWNDPGGLDGILEELEKSVPGDRIEILTHPEWWGKKNY